MLRVVRCIPQFGTPLWWLAMKLTRFRCAALEWIFIVSHVTKWPKDGHLVTSTPLLRAKLLHSTKVELTFITS